MPVNYNLSVHNYVYLTWYLKLLHHYCVIYYRQSLTKIYNQKGNIMEKVIYSLCNNLYTIKLLFAGMYDFETSEEKGLVIDPRINNIGVSGLNSDKANLKSDRVKVLKDYSKAYKEKKKEKSAELADCL